MSAEVRETVDDGWSVMTEVDLVASVVKRSETVERVVMTLVISGSDVEVFGTSVVNEVSSDTVVKISDVVIELDTTGRVELDEVVAFSSVVQIVTISGVVGPIVIVGTVVVTSETVEVVSGTKVVKVEK